MRSSSKCTRTESLFADAEGKRSLRVIPLICRQQCRRKIRMVWCVGVMLRLETEAAAPPIRLSCFANQFAVKKVAGVELHARLGGRHFKCASGLRLVDTRRALQPGGRRPSEHPVVIVALPVLDLLVGGIDARADRG